MRMLFYCCILLAAFSSCTQPAKENSINVIGQANMKVVPDMVEVSVRCYNVKPAMKDAVAETGKAVNEIMTVCNKYVQNPSDIKVSNISTNKAYEYRNNRDEFIGYDALQVLNITLKDISKIEQFTEELLGTKISRIENIRFNHTKADSIMREVNLLALDDARKTAEKMCEKMKVSLGKVIYISNYEQNASGHRGLRSSGNEYDMNLYNKSFGGRGLKMTAEILQFEDIAHASFEIN